MGFITKSVSCLLNYYFTKMIEVNEVDLRTIDIDKDKDIIVTFRKDSFVVSFGSEEGFGDEHTYLIRMKERVRKFPDGQVIIEKDQKPIGQTNFKFGSTKGLRLAM